MSLQVFSTFEDLGISVDVVATSEVSISLTLDPSKLWSRELIQQASVWYLIPCLRIFCINCYLYLPSVPSSWWFSCKLLFACMESIHYNMIIILNVLLVFHYAEWFVYVLQPLIFYLISYHCFLSRNLTMLWKNSRKLLLWTSFSTDLSFLLLEMFRNHRWY